MLVQLLSEVVASDTIPHFWERHNMLVIEILLELLQTVLVVLLLNVCGNITLVRIVSSVGATFDASVNIMLGGILSEVCVQLVS